MLICMKVMHNKMDDLLDVVGLTLWDLCDILTYWTAVLFRLDQDIKFCDLLQIIIDQNRSDYLGFKKNVYVLRLLQIRQRRTW